MEVIKSLETKEILDKKTTTKITSQEGGFFNVLRSLMSKAGLPLMKSVLTPLAKMFSLAKRLSAGMSAADAAFQKKIYRSGTAAFIISDKEMKDIMKIVKSIEESELLAKQLKMT